jgi:bifunctional UDP-N-acetylglucosamine pyrophosphorylase/glucosamine-1-phosphate N-acetyltransferase
MKSDLPKVLHPVLGQPMIRYAVNTMHKITNQKPVLVIGHGADQVRAEIGEDANYVMQQEQLGTAHAVQQAETLVQGSTDTVLVTSGDMPLFTQETISRLVRSQSEGSSPLTMLTVISENPRGFGRIVRDDNGGVSAIVEEADASPEQLKINELNVGAYAFSDQWLWSALKRVQVSPKGEFYLTDLVEIAVQDGHHVQAIIVKNSEETIGINTLEHLAEAGKIMLKRNQNKQVTESETK